MAGVPLANVLLLLVAVLIPTLAGVLIFHGPAAVDRLLRRRRARRVPAAAGPPIERLAADLRRVHRTLVRCPPGTPALRRRAARQAYDALLVQACAAVGVAHRLDRLPEGTERDLERLRVREALRAAGLAVP